MLCGKVLWPESGFQVLGFPRSAGSAKRFYGPNLGLKLKVFPGLLALRKGSMARIWVSISRFSQVCLLCEKALWPESGFQV